MKRVFIIVFLLTIMFIPLSVDASFGYSNVTRSSFSVRNNASTNAPVIGYLYGGVNVEIVDKASGNGCSTWYKIKYNDGYGCVCGVQNGSNNVELYKTQILRTNDRNPENEYERQLQSAGFPSSYWDKLSQLHIDHPNWNFIANKTGKDFSYVSWAETGAVSDGDIDKSLIQAPNNNTSLVAGYLKTDTYNYKSNAFAMQEAGGWYAARQDMVAYYLDPRNFLNENFIFQFELLSFNKTYHTKSVVENIFGSGYLRRYASDYVAAGESKNVSPVHLATRSVQEGLNKENFLTKGDAFTYNAELYPALKGRQFSNCFNFFNIGAYRDSINPAQNAAIYACGGPSGSETSYGRPWNTVQKALYGGAEIISGNYISKGQDTLYFQKYNTASYTQTALYGHQYMSNITAVAYEGSDTYDSYKALGLINSAAFTFVIPVYNNMPEATYIPSSLSPNNYLSSLKVDGVNVGGFDGDRTDGYNVSVASGKDTVSITGTTVVSGARIVVNNNQRISLNEGNNKISVKVIAPNKEERVYYVNVVREKAPVEITDDFDKIVVNAGYKHNSSYLGNIHLNDTGNTMKTKINNQNKDVSIALKNKNGQDKKLTDIIATGDKLTLTLNGKSKTYTLYVYGDVNGDGLARATDYVLIKNHIMTDRKLTGAEARAADVNNDDRVKATDYVLIRNHIMKGTVL